MESTKTEKAQADEKCRDPGEKWRNLSAVTEEKPGVSSRDR